MALNLRITGLCAGLALAAAGCGSDSEPQGVGGAGGSGGQTERVVEIFSWWIAPGEAEALQALIDVNKQAHPSDRVFNAAAESGDQARSRLAERLAANEPPDLFQQNAHDLSTFLEEHPGVLEELDPVMAEGAVAQAILPEVMESLKVNGKMYAMPVNIHRENALFYNKQILSDNGLTPPTTLPEFLQVCQTLKARGVTPIATAHQGWILRIMFNSIAMGSMGADAYNAFMTGGARNDAALGTAIDVFADVLANYVNSDAGNEDFGWTDAAEAVFEGRAAMFLHGDWAKGYYVQLGWTPGVDFGVLGAPGASDVFWYGVDIFSMPVGAPNPSGARDFLKTIGSLPGQVAFNRLKGSTPVRADVPREQLDSEGRAMLEDFEQARYNLLVVNHDEWDDAFLQFATDRDKNALLAVYATHPPVQ